MELLLGFFPEEKWCRCVPSSFLLSKTKKKSCFGVFLCCWGKVEAVILLLFYDFTSDLLLREGLCYEQQGDISGVPRKIKDAPSQKLLDGTWGMNGRG